MWDAALQRCKGVGGGGDCTPCSSPSNQNLCITGHVVSFVDPTLLATSASGLKVRAYNPIQFVTNPAQATVLGESTVNDKGCYTIDGIDRTVIGSLAAISVTDANSPMGGTYAVTGVGSTIAAGRNVSELQAYFIERTTVDTWASQVSDPTLLSDGFWIGLYLDAAGHPVSGVTPSRPNDDPPSSAIYCFRGDRMTLSTADTTDATGLCGISPDVVEAHTGTCGGATCSPPFPIVTGGTASGVIFIEPIQQM